MSDEKYYRFNLSRIRLNEDVLTDEQLDDLRKLESYWVGLVDEEFTRLQMVWVARLLSDFTCTEIMEAMDISADKVRLASPNMIERVFDDILSICIRRKATEVQRFTIVMKFEGENGS